VARQPLTKYAQKPLADREACMRCVVGGVDDGVGEAGRAGRAAGCRHLFWGFFVVFLIVCCLALFSFICSAGGCCGFHVLTRLGV